MFDYNTQCRLCDDLIIMNGELWCDMQGVPCFYIAECNEMISNNSNEMGDE